MAETPEAGKTAFTQPAKLGKPEAYKPNFFNGDAFSQNNTNTQAPAPTQTSGSAADGGANNAAADAAANNGANDTNNNGTNAGQPAPDAPSEISEDQLKRWFEKEGIPFENMDTVKSKLKATPHKELTPEEKEKLEAAKNKRLLDEHLSDPKRTVEEFAAIPKILSTDKKVLGMDKEMRELLAEGYTKESAEDAIKDRYYQYTDEEINAVEDKEERERMIKDRTMGTKRLERKGEYIKNIAQTHLDNLQQRIDDKDADAAFVEKHTSTVEDAAKKFQRKKTLNLGQHPDGKTDIPPIDDFEVSDTAIASAKEVLGNFDGFKQKLLTKEGHINLDFILPILVNHFSFEEAIKKSYLTAQNRAVDTVRNTFGREIPNLGNNQNEKGIPGKYVKAGKPEVVR